MKKKVIYLMLVLSTVTVLMGCGGGSSTYESNLNSGMEKFTSGDYNDMSEGEKDAVNDFLEWQSENY